MLKYLKIILVIVFVFNESKAQIIDTTFFGTADSLFTAAESYGSNTINKFGNNRVITCDIVNYNINTGVSGDFFQLDLYMSRFYDSYTFGNSFIVPINFGVNGSWPKVNIRSIVSKSGKKLIVSVGKVYVVNLEGIELEFQNTGSVNINTWVDSINTPNTATGFSRQRDIALIGDTLIYYPKYSEQDEIDNTLSLFNINTKAQLNISIDKLYRINLPQDIAYNDVEYSIKTINIVDNAIKTLVGKVYKNKKLGAPASLPIKQEEDYLVTTQFGTVILKDSLLLNKTVLNSNTFNVQENYYSFAPLGNKQFIIGIYDTLLNKVSKNLSLFSDNSDNYSFGNPIINYAGNLPNTILDFEYHNGLLYLHLTFSSPTIDSFIVFNPISNNIIYRKRLKDIDSDRGVFALDIKNNRVRVNQFNPLSSISDRYFVIFPSFPFPKDLNQKCLAKTGTIELETEFQNCNYNFQWKNPSNLILPGTTKTSIKYQTNGALVGDTLIMTYTTPRGLVGTNRIYYSFQPEAIAPPDTVIYCNPKKKLLKAINVNLGQNDYKWDRLIVNNRFNLFDTINVVDTGSYRLTVIRKSNGCAKSDTVKVNPDFVPAIGSVLPNQKLFISCKDTITNVFGTTNKTRAKLYWRNPLSNLVYANPLMTKVFGNYRIVTLDTVNGCKDSTTIINIQNKKINPQAAVIGSTSLITTLTCSMPSVSFTGTSTTAGTTFNWIDNNRNIYPNPITITSSSGFKLIVTDTVLGCIDSSQFRATLLNKAKPQFINFQKQRFITCDDVTITLSATTLLSGQMTFVWTDIADNEYPNPFNTSLPGRYIIQATDNINGCSSYDTVDVSLIPTLKFNVSNDTTICRGGTAILKANYTSPLNYTWSTGAASNSISVQPSGPTIYIVTGVKPSNGCTGKDTITVSIADTVAIEPLAFKPCDPISTTGTIKVNATGGIPPLIYSINNGTTFNSNNNFSNTPFGTYAIVVKDNIGCTYNSGITLNASSSLPVPNFIVPSNAVVGDTIVFVDITDPRPDSVKWTFPPNIQLVNDTNKFSPVVVVKAVGSSAVTVTAYYPNCEVPFTRTFNFGAVDTNFANAGNNNGIESVNVSPNPNSGVFDLEVKLYKKQNFAIFINNITTNFSQQLPTQIDSKYFLQNITLNTTTPGTYVVRVIAEYGAKQIKFVVN
jgi:hypothetical protein